MNYYNNLLYLFISMFIWGTIGAFILWTHLDPLSISFFRCLIGGGGLFIYCFLNGALKSTKISYSSFLMIGLSGILLIANWVLLFQSFIFSSITLGNISYYLQPIFLVIINFFVFGEKIELKKILFIGIAFIGVLLTLDLSTEDFSISSSKIYGISCAIVAGILYSIATVMAKYIKNIPLSLIILIQLSVGVVILLPFINFNLRSFSASLVFYLTILGFFHTAIAYILYYKAVKNLNITVLAVLSYVDPIIAILSDILFFNNSLKILQILGIFLTLLASYPIITPYTRKKSLKPVVYSP